MSHPCAWIRFAVTVQLALACWVSVPKYSYGEEPRGPLPLAPPAPETLSVVSEEAELDQLPVTEITLGELLDRKPAAREQRIRRLVEEALAAKVKTGAWQRLEDKKLVSVAAPEAALAGLKKNLAIEVSRHDAERTRRAILEAEAVFDPVFDLGFSYDESDTHERTIRGTVIQQTFQPIAPAGNPLGPGNVDLNLPPEVEARISAILGAPIRRIIFRPLVQQQITTDIFASRDQDNGALKTKSYDVALSQQLPWGPRFDISVATTDRDVFYDREGNSFDADWASSLLFNLELPVPGGRNFGPYAALDTAVKLSAKDAERGYWALKTTINSTLRDVDLSYLDLVQRLEELLIQIENRQLVERQSRHTERLFDQGYATNYDRAQIDAELAQARAQEEAAKNAFIAASDAFGILIEYSGRAVRENVYLPTNYPWLEIPLTLDTDSALAVAKSSRPEIHASRVDYEASEIGRAGAAVEAKPDVNANIAIESIQNGSVFGYKSYWDSLGNIADPDTLNQSYGVSYRYPWGNRAFKARLAQAEGGVEASGLAKRSTQNDVVRDVNDALSNLQAARARMEHAQRSFESAKEAYNRLARVEETGGSVDENELIINIRNLLTAKLAKIAATIDNKRAESSLLAAQGVIAQHYAGMTADKPIERYRLELLSEKGDFQYFLR
ncbi:MAG: TolC family protein [Gammaproteobacteria bacterium]